MQKHMPVALLATGPMSTSFLKRIPKLADLLGPVASTSLRLASRYSNLLKAGHPVDEIAAIGQCGTIIISAGRPDLFVDRMLLSSVDWKGKVVLLCHPTLGSESLERLKAAGVFVGSVTPVEGSQEKLFVAEGCPAALREARSLLTTSVRVMRIEPAQKALYAAGVCFATSLALPLMAASAEALRASGLGPHQALEVAEHLFSRTFRAYRKAGRNGWDGPVPRADGSVVGRHVQALSGASPMLADYYLDNVVLALKLFKRDPRWLEEMGTQINRGGRAAGR